MPEMIPAFAAVFDEEPDWPCPLQPGASVRFHVICLVSPGRIAPFRKQKAPYRPESVSQTLNAGGY